MAGATGAAGVVLEVAAAEDVDALGFGYSLMHVTPQLFRDHATAYFRHHKH